MSLVTQRVPATVAALLEPIEPQVPAGLFDIEDETYQAIDQEMVKLGGLHQGSIDWPYIEEASSHYLATRCKHFRILGHLLTVWLKARRWAQWSDAVCLLAGMVERYWETAHPKPGPTGYLAKRKQVSLMLERLIEALPALEKGSCGAGHVRMAGDALARLQSCDQAQLDGAQLTQLQRLLTRQSERSSAGAQRPLETVTAGDSSEAIARDSFLPARPSALGNERETRRAALTLAEQINLQDLYDPAGYLLRRFTLWAHIHAPPATRRERCTELAAVPQELVQSYQDALKGTSVEPAMLLRVEKSVVASPFWIRGSFLAAQFATRLAMDEVAEAIRQASGRFVRRIPALLELCFSDGGAFVDEQTRVWLSAAGPDSDARGPALEYGDLREELIAQLNTEGVEVVLLRLQALQARDNTPRQRCYASVIAADLLGERGLSWLADDLYANVARIMTATSAHVWEPELYQRLEQRGGPVGLIDQRNKG